MADKRTAVGDSRVVRDGKAVDGDKVPLDESNVGDEVPVDESKVDNEVPWDESKVGYEDTVDKSKGV